MIILGSNVFTCDMLSVTPAPINEIEYVELQNGTYDDWYITKDTTLSINDSVPEGFDFDTILHATFNGNANAGNLDFSQGTATHLLIKRREKGNFTWQTIYVRELRSQEDWEIHYNDYANASGVTYEYAVVPVLNGAEGAYSIQSIDSVFDQIFVADRDEIYGTAITDGFIDTTRNTPSSTVIPINSKYPVYVRNTIANYDTGTCTGMWVKKHGCEFEFENMPRITYQRNIMDFITNGQPKLLKHFDGRMWLINVVGDPTDSADTNYRARYITFQWQEAGDHKSESDMFYSNMSDVSEEWWVT